jgi:homoserine dehydrogenase
MASVEGSMNAVMVKSDAAGITLHYGAGAGSEETASAVIADLVDLARTFGADAHQRVPHLAFQSQALHALPVLPMTELVGSYYLRFDLAEGDGDGVVAHALEHLVQTGVEVQSHALLLHHQDRARRAFTLITGPARLAKLLQSVNRLQQLPHGLGAPTVLRVEQLT